jgi:pimeloyl-ACP methyl ester carboxylesterase
MALLLTSCSAPVQPPAPAVKESFYDYEGVKIRFREMGQGRPIVLIHGFGASLDTWRYITDALKIDHRLILLDLKGHGFSDRPGDEKYSLNDHADIVLGLIRHLGLKDVILVGHSFGSIVAVAAALQAGESPDPDITGLVLIGAALAPEHVPFFLKLLRVPLLGWLSVKLTTAPFRTRLMLLRAFYDHSKVTDELVELYARYQRIPGTEHAMVATAEQMVPENLPLLREKLATLRIPVLNIWGEQDVIVKRPGAESVCKILPRCRLGVITDSGHVPQEETPAKVVPLLREFFENLSQEASGGSLPTSSLSGGSKN